MSLAFAPPAPIRRPPWGALVSLGVHLGLGALLLFVSVVRPLEPPEQQPESISVELVNPAPPEQPAPLAVPEPAQTGITTAPAAPTSAAPGPETTKPPAVKAADGLTRATKLFSAGILKEPGSRKIVKTLATFADGERVVQLCNIEGLEQIRRANPRYNPDVLVSYAMADTKLDGMTLIADGGAFHSGRNWYGIRLRCTVSADYAGVTDFEFALGVPIPRSEWNSHNLPDAYEDSE